MYLNMSHVYSKIYKVMSLKKLNIRHVWYFLQVPNIVSPVKAKIKSMFSHLAGQQMEGRFPWPPRVLNKSGLITCLHYKKEVSLVQNQTSAAGVQGSGVEVSTLIFL